MRAKPSSYFVIYVILLGLSFWCGRASHRQDREVSQDGTAPSSSILSSITSSPPEPVEADEDESETGVSVRPFSAPEDILRKLSQFTAQDAHQLQETIDAWIKRDPEGAIAFLATGENAREMLRWLVKLWSAESPEQASAWLLARQEHEHYEAAVEGLTEGIASDDPTSALEWAKVLVDPMTQTRVWTAVGYELFRQDAAAAKGRLAESGLPASAISAVEESWAGKWQRSLRRVAMNVSAVASAATAAGANYDRSSRRALIDQVAEGVVIEGGQFDGEFFGVPNLTNRERQALEEWLNLTDEGTLSFNDLERE